MARLGHSSPRVALIYQHATRDRDRLIAEGLGSFIRDARHPSGGSEEEGPERRERDA
jgi:hypothetical protein